MRYLSLVLLLTACRPTESKHVVVQDSTMRVTKHAVLNDCDDRVGATGLSQLDRAGHPSTAYFGALRVCFKDRYAMSESAATALGADWMIWQYAFEAVKLGGSAKPADSIMRVLNSDSITVRRR